LVATQAEATLTMIDEAAGDIDETAFAQWIRQHVQAR
jgi:death-on-curing protein